MAKEKKGDVPGALADYDKAISLDSKNAMFFFNRGSARDGKGDLDGAIADYDQAVQLRPNSSKYYNNRGWAKSKKGDPAGAVADYDQAIKLQPENPDPYLNRAYAQYAGGHSAEAEADFQKALELKETDHDYPRFFICLIKMENPVLKAGAIQELSDYLPTRPSDATAWPLQVGLFLTGKLPESDFLKAADSSDAKQNANHHCEAYFYVGITHEIAGDKAGALPFFQKSVETNVTGFSECQISRAKLKASE
jgi:lipoprotein NlpI